MMRQSNYRMGCNFCFFFLSFILDLIVLRQVNREICIADCVNYQERRISMVEMNNEREGLRKKKKNLAQLMNACHFLNHGKSSNYHPIR